MEREQNDQTIEARGADLNRYDAMSGFAVPKIILASASPRRAEILRLVGWDFEILPAAIDESRRDGEDASSYVERLAREKAEEAAARVPNRMIVGADTTVVIDGEILEKPRDTEDARRMLRLLQERWHEVVTGICVINSDSRTIGIAHQITEVKFAPMSEDEINWYVATREPMDKAGGYAIQGLGARFIEEIRGDYLNVVGLPLRLLYEMIVRRQL
jgi:septum formation protein